MKAAKKGSFFLMWAHTFYMDFVFLTAVAKIWIQVIPKP